jgi:hypothetical protein
MGNQMAGREINQKRKKHMKSLVSIPALAGSPLAIKYHQYTRQIRTLQHSRILSMLGQMHRSMTLTQLPPILAWTPYQIQAMAPLLNVHHKLPQIPKLVRATTGNVI